jgi:hypothetical protein
MKNWPLELMIICETSRMSWCLMEEQDTYPLLSRSNILNATVKLDSGMLSSVTKKMYLVVRRNRLF